MTIRYKIEENEYIMQKLCRFTIDNNFETEQKMSEAEKIEVIKS